eukprot:scaffold183929_cov30-Tisochrysis_lutea.AAC.6
MHMHPCPKSTHGSTSLDAGNNAEKSSHTRPPATSAPMALTLVPNNWSHCQSSSSDCDLPADAAVAPSSPSTVWRRVRPQLIISQAAWIKQLAIDQFSQPRRQACEGWPGQWQAQGEPWEEQHCERHERAGKPAHFTQGLNHLRFTEARPDVLRLDAVEGLLELTSHRASGPEHPTEKDDERREEEEPDWRHPDGQPDDITSGPRRLALRLLKSDERHVVAVCLVWREERAARQVDQSVAYPTDGRSFVRAAGVRVLHQPHAHHCDAWRGRLDHRAVLVDRCPLGRVELGISVGAERGLIQGAAPEGEAVHVRAKEAKGLRDPRAEAQLVKLAQGGLKDEAHPGGRTECVGQRRVERRGRRRRWRGRRRRRHWWERVPADGPSPPADGRVGLPSNPPITRHNTMRPALHARACVRHPIDVHIVIPLLDLEPVDNERYLRHPSQLTALEGPVEVWVIR